jgi:hypothetical protein
MKQPVRIALAIAMTVLLLCAYNSQLARETAHTELKEKDFTNFLRI